MVNIEDFSGVDDNDFDEDTSDKKNNFDWKNKGFETAERLSLKINVHEANKYQAQKGKKNISELSVAEKKRRKKVRTSYDEIDEGGIDDDVILSLNQLQMNQTDASNGDNSLLNALSSTERSQLMQNTTLEVGRHQQNAGKLNALLQAETLSHKAGLSNMNSSDFANKMQDAIYNPRRTRRQALEKNIAKQLGIKGEIKKHSVGKIVEGSKKIKEVSGNHKVKNVNFNDVAKAGKSLTSKNATAELILEKSGQTARLSEIKMKKAFSSPTKDNENSRNTSKKMKEILKETLRKNDKVR